MKYLSELQDHESAFVSVVGGDPAFRLRLEEMGFVPGQEVTRVYASPLGTPIVFAMLGQKVALRRIEAARIQVASTEAEAMAESRKTFFVDFQEWNPKEGGLRAQSCSGQHCQGCSKCDAGKSSDDLPPVSGEMTFALVGNPNCGKTAFFNAASGSHQRTGNYAGITVSSVAVRTQFEGQPLRIVDLPGTYSLRAFSPEEAHVANELAKGEVDVIINVLDVNNLERNLLLTLQLRQYGVPMVGVLNMYDEFQESRSRLDIPELEKRLGMKLVPTVASKQRGVNEALREAVRLARAAEQQAAVQPVGDAHAYIHQLLDGIYELQEGRTAQMTARFDRMLASSPLAFLFAFAIMGLIFYATFELGAYPMDWMEQGVAWLSDWLSGVLPAGWLRDLLVGGIVGGVGSVIVFLPNILILYFFISILEDSGYLSRAALLFDPLLRRVGLHGKSFVPMLMGFGCNVPSVMATRTIEHRKSRMITMMTVPFMSCSARLPVYTVLAGAFFPDCAALVMLALYAGGILVAFAAAWLLNKVFHPTEQSHFVMEMPPYRMPVARGILRHTWEKGREYLRKMSGIILVASVVIWTLGYFPRGEAEQPAREQQEQSFLGQIGHAMTPLIEPLGYDWRMGVGILAGVGAKELMVSTLGVLYVVEGETEEAEFGLQQALLESGPTKAAALSYLVFALLYFPCMATIAAIRMESGRWKYAIFTAVYTTAIAYVGAFLVYRIALLLL